jgi:hypothetical protein
MLFATKSRMEAIRDVRAVKPGEKLRYEKLRIERLRPEALRAEGEMGRRRTGDGETCGWGETENRAGVGLGAGTGESEDRRRGNGEGDLLVEPELGVAA